MQHQPGRTGSFDHRAFESTVNDLSDGRPDQRPLTLAQRCQVAAYIAAIVRRRDTRSLDRRRRLEDAARDLPQASKAPSTLRAYRADGADYSGWCAAEQLLALPATPETISLCLAAACVIGPGSDDHRSPGEPALDLAGTPERE